jgi:hypothetical protein
MTNKHFSLLLAAILLLLVACSEETLLKNLPKLSHDNTVALFSQVSKENIDIGEPFKYTITLYQTDEDTAKLDKIKKEQFENLELYDFKEETKEFKNKNIKITRHTYFLQPSDVDDALIPGLILKTKDKTYTIKALTLKPNSVIPENQPLKDINDIKPIDKFFIFKIWYILVPLAIVILTFLFFYWLANRKKKKVEIEKPVIIKEPHLLALEELALLNRENPKTAEEFKEFYTRLSLILRVYIEGRFAIFAVERTTDEILSALQKIELNLRTRKLAGDVLKESDLVKFAKYLPQSEDAKNGIKKVYQFVDTTKIDSSILDNHEAMSNV